MGSEVNIVDIYNPEITAPTAKCKMEKLFCISM